MSMLRTAAVHDERFARTHAAQQAARAERSASGWPRHPSADPSRRASATSPAASCCRATASTRLLDEGSPFLEIAPLAADGLYGGDAPAPASSRASGWCTAAR